MTCLLFTLVVVFVVLHEDTTFETESVFVPSPELDDVGFDDDNAVVGEVFVDPDVKVGVTWVVAFEFIEEVATPAVVTVGCTAEELAIRSESLSDISELLEELSLMLQ